MTSVNIGPFSQWQITSNQTIEGLKLIEDATTQQIDDEEVLVEMHAASLNYRDLFTAKGGIPGLVEIKAREGLVPGCDGAGIVKAVGKAVTTVKPGDKVVTYVLAHTSDNAKIDFAMAGGSLGMGPNGTLTQYGVFHHTNLLHAPSNLSFEEAATLTCSGLTAYNALFGLGGRQVQKDDWVLVQGTGGISIAALQLAVAVGAHVVATTSSSDKAASLKGLGAKETLNYRDTPEWGAPARALVPNSVGFDHVIDIGGNATLGESLKAVKTDGVVSTIGIVGGPVENQVPMMGASQHVCIVRGMVAGTRQQMRDYIRFVEEHDLKPALDTQKFSIKDVREAYWRQERQQHFSKVIIQLQH